MNTIQTAIKMEQEAIDFYTKCADKTNNAIGRKMFLSIAEDEKYHIACATAGQRVPIKLPDRKCSTIQVSPS